jgi:hypothetical protein
MGSSIEWHSPEFHSSTKVVGSLVREVRDLWRDPLQNLKNVAVRAG